MIKFVSSEGVLSLTVQTIDHKCNTCIISVMLSTLIDIFYHKPLLHCYASLHLDCDVTMQVKRVIDRTILNKLPIYNEYMLYMYNMFVLSLHIIC